MLKELSIEGYLGVPLVSSTGQVLGIMVALTSRPVDPSLHPETLLQIFAGKAAAEIERQRAAMQQLASAYGGTYADFPLWGPFGRTLTVHNLGGCALSNSVDQGVVGIDGQVHGHAGLYVCDGAVIPTAIGSHPVMTIAAVAEFLVIRRLYRRDHLVQVLAVMWSEL